MKRKKLKYDWETNKKKRKKQRILISYKIRERTNSE